jgi:hypothetical protein
VGEQTQTQTLSQLPETDKKIQYNVAAIEDGSKLIDTFNFLTTHVKTLESRVEQLELNAANSAKVFDLFYLILRGAKQKM